MLELLPKVKFVEGAAGLLTSVPPVKLNVVPDAVVVAAPNAIVPPEVAGVGPDPKLNVLPADVVAAPNVKLLDDVVVGLFGVPNVMLPPAGALAGSNDGVPNVMVEAAGADDCVVAPKVNVLGLSVLRALLDTADGCVVAPNVKLLFVFDAVLLVTAAAPPTAPKMLVVLVTAVEVLAPNEKPPPASTVLEVPSDFGGDIALGAAEVNTGLCENRTVSTELAGDAEVAAADVADVSGNS